MPTGIYKRKPLTKEHMENITKISIFQKGEKNPNWKGGVSLYNKEYYNKKAKEYYHKRRFIILSFYGGNPPRCACCGEQTIEFLSIDHINGGGKKHRKELCNRSGYALYAWIKKNNFPVGFQVLCHNCNMAKGFYGKCPHNIKVN